MKLSCTSSLTGKILKCMPPDSIEYTRTQNHFCVIPAKYAQLEYQHEKNSRQAKLNILKKSLANDLPKCQGHESQGKTK